MRKLMSEVAEGHVKAHTDSHTETYTKAYAKGHTEVQGKESSWGK